MAMSREQLREWLIWPNVRAFLMVVRAGESSLEDKAYRMIYRGELIDSLDRHPRIVKSTPWGNTTAAGAYQFMAAVPGKVKTDTWDGLERIYGTLDFSPDTQDEMAVALIARRGALEDVRDGRFELAVRKCGREWASLPGSPYGQPTRTMAQAMKVYRDYGGQFESEAQFPQEVPMAPIVLPLLQAAATLIPQLGQLFGSGSEVANRNVAAGKIVAETLVKATESVNLQEAVEKINSDGAALAAAKEAVAQVWPSITESGGGGIKSAREAAFNPDQVPPWKNPAVWVAVAVLPLVYMVAIAVLYGVGGQTWSDDIKMMVVTAIVSGALGSVTGFFLGSSLGSQKKDAMMGAAK